MAIVIDNSSVCNIPSPAKARPQRLHPDVEA